MNYKILVLDDEKEIAEVISLYLKNEGYEVTLAYTGCEALHKIEEEQPDLALLDVMLPDIDGFRVLQKIRERYTFPVIMLTAKTEYTDRINGLTLATRLALRHTCSMLFSFGRSMAQSTPRVSV